jgi:cytochrome c553
MKLKMLIVITLFASLALVAACSKSEDEPSSLEKTTEQAAGAVSEAASDVKHAAGEAMDKAGEMAADATDATGEAMSDMGEAGSEAMDKAGEMAADARDATGEAMSDMGEAGSEAMHKTGEMADRAMDAAGSMMAGGDAANGKALSVDCADCHGENGLGDDETTKLTGLDEAYFVEQMLAFKSGTRKDEGDTMMMYAENLSEQDMADLAAYYASLPAE